MNFFNCLTHAPIVPTVFPASADALCAYADVLEEEGFPVLELLCRPTSAGMEIMRQINERPARHKIRWGLGTITNQAIAEAAVAVRPDFLVSPAFSPAVLEVAVRADIPYMPGVQTFQDIQSVVEAFDRHRRNVHVLKLCPVFHLSAEYVEALRGCFPGIQFCPTGEVTLENYLHWKRMPGIAAPMGSQFVPREWIEALDLPAIRDRLREIKRLASDCPTRDS